jgi:hypothetical protein
MGSSISNINLINSDGESIPLEEPLNKYKSLGAGVMIIVNIADSQDSRDRFIIGFRSYNGKMRISCGGAVEESELKKAIIREYYEETFRGLIPYINDNYFKTLNKYLLENNIKIGDIEHYLLPLIHSECLHNTYLLFTPENKRFNYISTYVELLINNRDIINIIEMMNKVVKGCLLERETLLKSDLCPDQVFYERKNEIIERGKGKYVEALLSRDGNSQYEIDHFTKLENISKFTEFTEFKLLPFDEVGNDLLSLKPSYSDAVKDSFQPLFRHDPKLQEYLKEYLQPGQ